MTTEAIARQILTELQNQIPMQEFNDDDWYEWVEETGQFVRSYGRKSTPRKPQAKQGNRIESGMTAKWHMIWRKPSEVA